MNWRLVWLIAKGLTRLAFAAYLAVYGIGSLVHLLALVLLGLFTVLMVTELTDYKEGS